MMLISFNDQNSRTFASILILLFFMNKLSYIDDSSKLLRLKEELASFSFLSHYSPFLKLENQMLLLVNAYFGIKN